MKQWCEMSEWIKGIPVSRYIASWYIAGGKPQRRKIEEWLRSLAIDGQRLTEEEVELIWLCITNGKLELQESAKKFV